MDSITDIIQDLKADDPMTGVLEVVETLENAQTRIEELTAFIDRVAEDDSQDNYWMEDARAALKNGSCDHEWIDPSNEKVVAGNWRLCLKCLILKEVSDD